MIFSFPVCLPARVGRWNVGFRPLGAQTEANSEVPSALSATNKNGPLLVLFSYYCFSVLWKPSATTATTATTAATTAAAAAAAEGKKNTLFDSNNKEIGV